MYEYFLNKNNVFYENIYMVSLFKCFCIYLGLGDILFFRFVLLFKFYNLVY